MDYINEKLHHIKLLILLSFSMSINAQELHGIEHRGLSDFATPPGDIADSVISFRPSIDMALDKAERTERIIEGEILETEKGIKPDLIIQNANTIIIPLKKGVPVKMFLKRFPKQEGYYPIAIFPMDAGVKL